MDYGAPAFASARPQVLRKLNVIHHAALRLATGAFRTSPVDSILIESTEWPLHLRRSYLLTNAFIHVRSTSGLPPLEDSEISVNKPHAKKLLSTRANSYLRSLDIQSLPPLLHQPLPAVAPWCPYAVNVDRSIISLPKASTLGAVLEVYHAMISKYTDFRILFTDGSKSNSGAGCSVVLNNDITRFSLPKFF